MFLNAKLDGVITPLRPELTYALRRRDVRPLGTGAYIRTGHWYELAEHPYDYIVWVYDESRPPVRDARVIAAGRIFSRGRMHTVTVALSRAPRSASRPANQESRQTSAAAAVANGWSAPAGLPGCASGSPRVAFPSEGPFAPTGPGAIVWARGPCRPGGAGGRALAIARLDDGRARAGAAMGQAFRAAPALSAVGASFGRVAVAAAPQGGGGDAGTLVQARAGDQPARPALRAGAGQPLALARAYLGDVATATVVPGPAIAVRVQRYFQHRFGPPRLIPIPAGRLGALVVTLDYRSDVLVAWQQSGSVYAHMLRASGRPEPTQRAGDATAKLQLQALVSDNDHGMLAWSSTSSEGVPLTSVYYERSGRGVRFGAPRRLALFADPAGAGSTAGSLALVRLSNENVLLAWTQVRSGRYAVQVAPAVYAGRRPAALLSDPGSDSVLADVATGPEREAIAVWRSTPGGTGFDPSRAELWTARTFTRPGDRPASASAVRLAAAGPLRGAGAGVDPASDRPVVAWLAGDPRPHVEYIAGRADPRYRPRAARGATHWLRITLAGLGSVALLAGLGLALLRRRARRAAGRAGRS